MGLTAQKLPPLAIYLHWPFCDAICPYCDFNVHSAHLNKTDNKDWLAAYRAELNHAHHLRPFGQVETVFFGGGTPSLMSPDLVGGILNAIDDLWGLDARAEISLEANPVSAAQNQLQGLADAGVTRLSLGVQAFDDAALKMLGRTHSAVDAKAAFLAAQNIFTTSSFDLIYARPSQTLTGWKNELQAALALAPQHMSLYQLTIEAATPFENYVAQGKLSVPDEELSAALYEATQELCVAADLPAYEISNHAQAAHQCAHNRAIWQGGDYIGIGPGAHGRVTVNGQKHASLAHKNPQIWWQACAENGHGWLDLTPLAAHEAAEELVMLGLRLCEGRPLHVLAAQGASLSAARLDALKADGLLVDADNVLQATDKGRLLLDYIIGRLLA